jgi:hypothetical protein
MAASLRKKIDDMVKSKEAFMNKTLETKMFMAGKKLQEKNAMWQALWKDGTTRLSLTRRRRRP